MNREKRATASQGRPPSRGRASPPGPSSHCPRAAGHAEGIRGILARALDAHGLARRIERRLPLSIWTAAVGCEIAARARPTLLAAGTLHVVVQDHRWRDQLDAARALIIGRLNQRLGRQAIRELRFGPAHPGFLAEQHALDPVGNARAFAAALPPRCASSGARLLGQAQLPGELHEALALAAGAALRRARPSS